MTETLYRQFMQIGRHVITGAQIEIWVTVCETCGAAVNDQTVHNSWHERLAEVPTTTTCLPEEKVTALAEALAAHDEPELTRVAPSQRRMMHHRSQVQALAPLVAGWLAEERERIAQAIEARRNAHGRSCPGDYAAHDAYYAAARIARGDA